MTSKNFPNDSGAFEADLFESAYPRGIEKHYWIRARNRIIEHTLKRFVPRESRVLDIGCGPGLTVSHLYDSGWICFGCDTGNPTTVATAARLFVARPFQSLPPELLHQINCVLLLDVLEHIPDPKSFLISIRSSMANLTRVVITVPARKELWSNYDVYYGHYCRYEKVQLEDLLRSSGLQVVEARHLFGILYLILWFVIRMGTKRPLKFRSPRFMPLHRLMEALILMEYHSKLTRRIGTTLLIVAKP